jgi:hypothetical protein
MEIELTIYNYLDAIHLEETLTKTLDAMAYYGNSEAEMQRIATLLILVKCERVRHFRQSERDREAIAKAA